VHAVIRPLPFECLNEYLYTEGPKSMDTVPAPFLNSFAVGYGGCGVHAISVLVREKITLHTVPNI
jgi:hypothetical protein